MSRSNVRNEPVRLKKHKVGHPGFTRILYSIVCLGGIRRSRKHQLISTSVLFKATLQQSVYSRKYYKSEFLQSEFAAGHKCQQCIFSLSMFRFWGPLMISMSPQRFLSTAMGKVRPLAAAALRPTFCSLIAAYCLENFVIMVCNILVLC